MSAGREVCTHKEFYMNTFNCKELEDGVNYFCVYQGAVHYLTARLTLDDDFYTFFYEDVHGGSEEKFFAYECDLIYQL